MKYAMISKKLTGLLVLSSFTISSCSTFSPKPASEEIAKREISNFDSDMGGASGNADPYRFGGSCTARGRWTSQAEGQLQQIYNVLEDLKNNPDCQKIWDAMKKVNLASAVSEISPSNNGSEKSATGLEAVKQDWDALKYYTSNKDQKARIRDKYTKDEVEKELVTLRSQARMQYEDKANEMQNNQLQNLENYPEKIKKQKLREFEKQKANKQKEELSKVENKDDEAMKQRIAELEKRLSDISNEEEEERVTSSAASGPLPSFDEKSLKINKEKLQGQVVQKFIGQYSSMASNAERLRRAASVAMTSLCLLYTSRCV